MDKNGLESRNRLPFGICLGQVISVDTERRVCKVISLSTNSYPDTVWEQCQWLNMSSGTGGDEITVIPKPNSIGLVFVVDGIPYLHGFMKGIRGNRGAVTGTETNVVTEGDFVIGTDGGSRFTVKSNGSLELFSKETLNTIYFPPDSSIKHFCRNNSLTTDAGYTVWENLSNVTNQTKYTAEYRKDLLRTSVVFEEKGEIDATTILKTSIGPGVPGIAGVPVPIFSHSVLITGETLLEIGPAGAAFKALITPTGEVTIDAATDITVNSLLGNVTVTTTVGDISVESAAGNVTVATQGGDVSVTTDVGNIEVVTSVGSLELGGSEGKLKLAQGKVALGGPGGELVAEFDKLLTTLTNFLTSIATETHVGNMGYPTAPPTNAADYAKAMSEVTASGVIIKTILGSL